MSDTLKRIAELLEESAGDLPMDSSQSLSLWRTAHAIREALAEQDTVFLGGVTGHPATAEETQPAPSADLVEQMRICAEAAAPSPNNYTYLNPSAREMLRNAIRAIEAKDAEIARLKQRDKDAVDYQAMWLARGKLYEQERDRAERAERERAEVEKQLFAANQDKAALETKARERDRWCAAYKAALEGTERRLDKVVKALEESHRALMFYEWYAGADATGVRKANEAALASIKAQP